MRLTIINQFYVPDISPTAHLCASLAEHRAGHGDSVTVVTSRGGYVAPSREQRREDRRANPRVIRVWTPQLGKKRKLFRIIDYAFFYLFAALRVLFLPRQDVIVSLTTPPMIAWAGVLHRMVRRGTKLVLWNMDCYPEVAERTGVIRYGGVASRLMRWANRRLFRRIDHLICLDTAMVELLMGAYAPKGRTLPVTVLPNWEKADLFPDGADPGRWERTDALGLDGRFVVLYLGNTGYGHRFETVMDAAESLRDEPVTFVFVGGGSRWDEIEQAVAERNLDNVIMHGYVPKEQTPAVMAAADCALITLRDESLGVMSPSKLHSNLAMRLPVIYIGPAKSNVDDAIQEYECGVSVRHGDVDGVVSFIQEMMRDDQQRRSLQTNAREAFDLGYCDVRTLPRFDEVLGGLHEATQVGGAVARATSGSSTADG